MNFNSIDFSVLKAVLKRYRIKVGVHDSDTGWDLVYEVDAREHPDGEWVKWEDVQKVLETKESGK